MLDHAGLLAVPAHHIARGVLQIDDGMTELAHPLNEVRGLVGSRHINGAVVRDQSHGMAAQMSLRADRGRAIAGLEKQQLGAIDQPRHDLAHIDRFTVMGRHQPQQLRGTEARLGNS